MTFMRRAAFALLAAAVVAIAVPAGAQPYPKKGVIKIIVPQAVGSATDTIGRALATHIGAEIGQQIIVDNRPGAGGLLGSELAAKAQPDGYTLFLANISTHGVNPGLYPKLPYDPIKDFAPIGLAGGTSNILIVNAELPIKSVKELIDHAKARPGMLRYASPGQGSSQHLAVELFRTLAGGIDVTHLPYRGSGPGVIAVMGGEASFMMPATPSALPAIKSNKGRAIAVSSVKRHPDFPDLPTIAETFPGFDVTSWYGLSAPAGTPQPILDELSAAMRKALANPAAVKVLLAAGMEPTPSTPSEFGAFIKAEIDKWTKVARAANVKIE
jgi:tripartite-type tricarboxylate transporter receptor subunit TctC